jgi:hypothetical protein
MWHVKHTKAHKRWLCSNVLRCSDISSERAAADCKSKTLISTIVLPHANMRTSSVSVRRDIFQIILVIVFNLTLCGPGLFLAHFCFTASLDN